jgi:hypothetical protein
MRPARGTSDSRGAGRIIFESNFASCREEYLHLMMIAQLREDYIMRVFLFSAVCLLVSTVAQAEIMCTDNGGCWETGKRIRLLASPYRGVDTTLPSRDGNGRVDVRGIPIANDYPYQHGPHFIARPVR